MGWETCQEGAFLEGNLANNSSNLCASMVHVCELQRRVNGCSL